MVSCFDCVVLIASSGVDYMRGSARVVALLVRTATCMHARVLNTVTARAYYGRLTLVHRPDLMMCISRHVAFADMRHAVGVECQVRALPLFCRLFTGLVRAASS